MTLSTVFRLGRWAILGAAALISVSIVLYPGGTFLHPSSDGYSFLGNSLSDLGRTVTWEGEPNRRGALFFAAGAVLLALAGIGCLLALVRLYSSVPRTRILARAAGVVGLLSCVGLIGAAVMPEDRMPDVHGQFTLLGAGACPVAASLFAMAASRDDRFPRRVAVGWLVLALVLVGWVSAMRWGPPPTTERWLTISVTLQKVVALAVVGIFTFQCYEAERVVAGVAAGTD